jgi:hypothetical protein
VGVCKAKWASLHNSLSREMRDGCNPSGSGAKEKNTLYLRDAISFIDDFMKTHKITSCSLEHSSFENSRTDSLKKILQPLQNQPS